MLVAAERAMNAPQVCSNILQPMLRGRAAIRIKRDAYNLAHIRLESHSNGTSSAEHRSHVCTYLGYVHGQLSTESMAFLILFIYAGSVVHTWRCSKARVLEI